MKGILFKPDMIKAVVEGRKTQTRRVIREARELSCKLDFRPDTARYQTGGTVYIKEAFYLGRDDAPYSHTDKGVTKGNYDLLLYKSHTQPNDKVRVGSFTFNWRSPLFMPAWAARYFIRITDVRAERLQEITEEDAIAEGSQIVTHLNGKHVQAVWTERQAFKNIWDSINKPPYDWDSNPWVFVYTFELIGR